MGRSVQLLYPRCSVGTDVCPGLSVFSIPRTDLPESALLARPTDAPKRHPFPAIHQCLLTVLGSRRPPTSRRFAYGRRSSTLRSEMATATGSLFYPARTPLGRD